MGSDMMRIRSQETAFASDTRPFYGAVLKLGIGLIVIVVATLIDQLRTDRFPTYDHLGVTVVVVTAGALAVVALAIFLAGAYFKVYVSRDYLYCYDTAAVYQRVSWLEITNVELVDLHGFRYVYVHAHGLTRPVTVPVRLKRFSHFVGLVGEYAGTSHPLTQALAREQSGDRS